MNWLGVLLGEAQAEENATESTKKLVKALKLVETDDDRAALAEWLETQHEKAKSRRGRKL